MPSLLSRSFRLVTRLAPLAVFLLGCTLVADPSTDDAPLDQAGAGGSKDNGPVDGASGGTTSSSGGAVSMSSGGDTGSGGTNEGSGGQQSASRDITFFAVADTHADPPPAQHDLNALSAAINSVSKGGSWPSHIGGVATGFVEGPIAAPLGVVFLGDITGWGTAPTEIETFRRHFQTGYATGAIEYPSYIGLGNHDVDSADRDAGTANYYRSLYWGFVDERHKGPGAPVPVTNFDAGSHAYSWDWQGVHFFQAHRFAGDDEFGLPSSLGFLKSDLATHASDGRPVFLFHHYGMDAFGSEERWWTNAERAAYRDALAPYNVISIFAGHSHAAFQYEWEGRHVVQVNNAKAENGKGNNDGNGSFAIARVTEKQFSMVTCRWLDNQGNYELIAPFYNVTW